MSRKSRKKRRRQRVNSRQTLLNEIKDLESSILECSEKIKEVKKDNFKAFNIRNLKVFRGACNLVLPFVVMSGITVGVVKLCNGGYPFYDDIEKRYKKYEVESDLENGINAKDEYANNGWWSEALPSNSLTFYTGIEKEDDLFVRYKRKYSIPDDSFYDVYDAIIRNDYDYIVENYVVSLEEKIVSNVLDSVNSDSFIEARLYHLDEDDILSFPESPIKGMIVTIAELIIIFGSSIFINFRRDYDFSDDLYYINKEYKSNFCSLEPLENELNEKREKLLVLNAKRGGNSNGK